MDMKKIITPYICLALLSVMWYENKLFHWTVLTVTDTHFNRLQIYGWTSLTAHFQKKKKKRILSVWFVFGYFNGWWNVPLYFTSNRPNSRRKDGLLFFPPLCVGLWVLMYFFLARTSSGRLWGSWELKKGLLGPSTAKSSYAMLWC